MMSRYPYTYSADYLRMIGPQDGISPVLSRSDAAAMKAKIAEAIGMPEVELASKLANAYMRHYGVEHT